MKGKFILLVLALIVSAVAIAFLSEPLRRSNEHIKRTLLSIAPVGTSMEDVLEMIEGNKNWSILQGGGWRPWPSVPDDSISLYTDTFKEMKSIRVLLGTYRTIFETSVSAYWEFDEDLNLIDIRVTKSVDVI